MDLLGKSVVAAIIIVIVLFSAYALLRNSFTQHVTEQQAVSLVKSDLANSYPGSVVNVTNVTPSQFSGSWHIVTSIIQNGTTPCPYYAIYTFDYPQYGFVYRVENIYTQDCIVYGLQTNKSYIIASYPVAIARSYSLNTTAVRNYVAQYGYNNMDVHATYYNSTTANGHVYTNVWAVNYSAPGASSTVAVLITQSNGNLVTTTNQSK